MPGRKVLSSKLLSDYKELMGLMVRKSYGEPFYHMWKEKGTVINEYAPPRREAVRIYPGTGL